MSNFLQEADGADVPNVSSVIGNFQKKNGAGPTGSSTTNAAANTTAGNHMVSRTTIGSLVRVNNACIFYVTSSPRANAMTVL